MGVLLPERAQRPSGICERGNTSVHAGVGCSYEGVIKNQRGKGGTSLVVQRLKHHNPLKRARVLYLFGELRSRSLYNPAKKRERQRIL